MIKRVAIIDIGTLKTKCIVAEFDENLNRKILYKDKEVTVLGKNMHDRKKFVSEESIVMEENALKKYMQVLKEYEVENFRVIATEAIRVAKNSNEICKRILKIVKKEPEILSHEEEARIYYKAVATDIGGKLGVSDIGGGSIQLIIGDGEIIDKVYLLKTGVYMLQQKFGSKNFVNDNDIERTWKCVESAVHKLHIKTVKGIRFVYGSTNIIQYIKETGIPRHNSGISKNHPYVVKVSDLMEFYWKIVKYPFPEREKFYPSEPYFMWGADAAIVNVVTLCMSLGVTEFIPSDMNISDGLLLELARRN